jgi:hypothetical protein
MASLRNPKKNVSGSNPRQRANPTANDTEQVVGKRIPTVQTKPANCDGDIHSSGP